MALSLSESPDTSRQKILIITTDESILNQLRNDSTKRALIEHILISSSKDDSSNSHQSDIISATSKKSRTKDSGPLTCVICGSLAHGYNFGAIACEGCKAFFRRNAHKDPKSLRCNNDGKCQITLQTRRECSACRLSKCLKSGMQPDRLSTDEQKIAKRRKIEENRNLIGVTIPKSTSSDPSTEDSAITPSTDSHADFADFTDILSPLLTPTSMSFEELQRVETISMLYQKRIELATREGLPWDPSVQSQTFLQTLNSQSVPVMRLLSFFKQIPEFNQLNVDDKVTLIKYNLLELLAINCALCYDAKTNQIIETSSDAPLNTEFYRVLHGYSFGMRIKKIFESFLSIAQYDQKIIHLTLITLVLTKGFSASGSHDEPVLNDNMAVYRAQNYYAELLWKYLDTIHGYEKAIKLLSKLMGNIVAWQTVQETLRNDVMRTLSPEDMNQLVPIMRSVLKIP